ncbi:MAG: helix-turn-helix domain-containing protein [Lachnospiraceae bacterium]|nr:helix-turn-helix domain-containing protein [Lachnospiraceae bacterium]
MDLGKILKEERIKQGISQQRLAQEAGVTKRAIIYWENGKKKMNVESADKVFKALHTTVTIGDVK